MIQAATKALSEASASLDRARRDRENLDTQLHQARQRLQAAAAEDAARRAELRGLEDSVAAAAVAAEMQRSRLEVEVEGYRKEEAALRAEATKIRDERLGAESRKNALREEAKRAREEKVKDFTLLFLLMF
jgi:hypothetical protein